MVLAFDIPGLVSLAQRADCVIELVPQVGDFIAIGDPLFRISQTGPTLPTEALRHSVAVGQERTLEQDPTFAFRIIVDVASKGLSPAINDPTTAVLALDQIHHLLRDVGNRQLNDERVRDAAGRLRLVYRTPDWEDFVQLAVTEIRHFGEMHSGCPAPPSHAPEPDSNVARRACCGAASRVGTAAPVSGALFHGTGRSSLGGRQRFPRRRWASQDRGAEAGRSERRHDGDTIMTMDPLIQGVVTITLMEMMGAVGVPGGGRLSLIDRSRR